VTTRGNDIGVTAAYARTLIYYAAREGATANGTAAKNTAKGLLDRLILLKAQDPTNRGIVVPETRADYNRFDDPVFVPSSFSGTMPNGDPINASSTFVSIRSWYRNDPQWPAVQAYLNGGAVPSLTYHRFWAQADVAMAFADYGALFPAG
jgi:hypothetical protein